QKLMMLQVQGIQGWRCNEVPRTLGNEGDAASSVFPKGKKYDKFILFLEVTTGRFQKLKPIISNPLLLFFLNLFWHIFYATMGLSLNWDVIS
ncbi:hypothetical protein LCGC14_2733340, partial [marine sediment metagenome]